MRMVQGESQRRQRYSMKRRSMLIKRKGQGKAKVLIADDERDLVAMLAYNLRKKGYQSLTAYNGFEAWEKIESERPDVIILDLMMPELDGWELCRLVRRSQTKEINDMGILMLTARAMPEDRVYGLEIGADDYLTKPFSLSELILRVEKLAGEEKVCISTKRGNGVPSFFNAQEGNGPQESRA